MEGEEERDGRKKRKGEMEGMKERKKMRKEGECEGRGGGEFKDISNGGRCQSCKIK